MPMHSSDGKQGSMMMDQTSWKAALTAQSNVGGGFGRQGETTFDEDVAKSIAHTRWLQLKCTYKLWHSTTIAIFVVYEKIK